MSLLEESPNSNSGSRTEVLTPLLDQILS